MNSLNIKRVSLYLLILLIGIVVVWQLYYFVPGFLLAITLYILCRKTFFRLTEKRGWKRGLAAMVLILLTILILALPIWAVVEVLIPKVDFLITNSSTLIAKGTVMLTQIKQKFPQVQVSQEQLQAGVQRAVMLLPGILGTTASVITNFVVALFVVYFMFLGGRKMEHDLLEVLPLKPESKMSIWKETHTLVVSNAIGIPVLAFLQAIVASLGYWIFGVQEYLVWGLLTGVCSLLPVVGTMIIWVPIVAYMFAVNHTGPAIGLTLYSVIVISNIDNVLRFTILKKIGDVHPLITVFGVLLGLQLFGIMGLIFGPLFISYFILLVKVYRAEFEPEA
ncbi:MAG: AI-2E family transporter [Sphingobacteriales bacterium]|nr:MAG: AI-2E family transporter [Sphingobacteriales bacterium]